MDFMNGAVVYSTGIYGTVATYSCSAGFALNGGDKTRTCVSDGRGTIGSFNGIEPTCERKLTCDSLYRSNCLVLQQSHVRLSLLLFPME